jgi:small subunit ribosomal protein S8
MQTDPIADFLTSVRNASNSRKQDVTVPSSKVKVAIAEILKREGYLGDFEVLPDNKQNMLKVTLRYQGKEGVINFLQRVSKPGRRIYVGKADVERVLGGLGIAVLSTPRGLVTDRDARRAGVGGEVLLRVY